MTHRSLPRWDIRYACKEFIDLVPLKYGETHQVVDRRGRQHGVLFALGRWKTKADCEAMTTLGPRRAMTLPNSSTTGSGS